MEFDGKTVATILGAFAVGGGGGVATSQVNLAALQTKVQALEEFKDERTPWGERLSALEAQLQALNDRVDREARRREEGN